jgi:multidrug efflux pump
VNISAPFIHRPVATTLLTVALALSGGLAYFFLPVASLPQVDIPTIAVNASLPGASAETMASSVATPLERQFGRIAAITEMTSTSSLGATNITIQFDLNRDANAAARDVQAAINAARGQLPANLPNNPTYRKVNPADAPIMIIAVQSDIYDRGRMYDAASSILAQKLSQIDGVGQVSVGGGALPAVRVNVNPPLLNNIGLSLEDVRATLASANANRPKGSISGPLRTTSLFTTDQLSSAKEYRPLLLGFRNGAAVRLKDVARVSDSVEDTRTAGMADGRPAILLIVNRQPGANIIETVDRVHELLPQLQASVPPGMRLVVVLDRTMTIRASVRDVQETLFLSMILVILVVFFFLRNVRATLIPSVAVPVSLVGTFGVMYLCNYSLDNLSLMALTIATGFVVDDAIVVIENIARHLEAGMDPMEASLKGASEIGFTVVSISVSLVAVFIPILLMGGIVGRLFREFAVTLSVAIAVSMLVSLTTTPMMCARLLRQVHPHEHGRLYRWTEALLDGVVKIYEVTLRWVMRNQPLMLLVTIATVAFTVYLYTVIPKGFFPQQDTGRLAGQILADQHTSSQSLRRLLTKFALAVGEDPAVGSVMAFSGGGGNATNVGRMFTALKPLEVRRKSPDGISSVDEIIGRIRGRLSNIPGATLYLQATQDLRVGGFVTGAQYQFTLQDDDLKELMEWAPRVLAVLRKVPGLVDVNSDQQNHGLQAKLKIDRATASRLGITPKAIDDTLYDAFGQRQVSTMYSQLNQYHVVMEAESQFGQTPDGLRYIYVRSNTGKLIPLSAITHYAPATGSLTITHKGFFPSITISFNLAPGFALGSAVAAIEQATLQMGLPGSIIRTFTGTAQAFQDSLRNEPYLILAAFVTVYIVLGVLYESYIHPITILSTLPSAGVGALLALLYTGTELSVIALIGIILLIGIVKKNAIMMIDFALEAEREHGKTPEEAIFEACLLRFRPITMTTMAALLGGLPLALGTGTGSELRRPLGIAIVGGLIFSQMVTLYTTPVIYLYLDRLRLWWGRRTGTYSKGDGTLAV